MEKKQSAISVQQSALEHLGGMMKADMELYEKILDTPVFAYHFNELAKQSAALTERVRVLTDVIRKMCDEVAHTSGLRNEYQDWNAFWEISETALHPPPAQAGQAEGG